MLENYRGLFQSQRRGRSLGLKPRKRVSPVTDQTVQQANERIKPVSRRPRLSFTLVGSLIVFALAITLCHPLIAHEPNETRFLADDPLRMSELSTLRQRYLGSIAKAVGAVTFVVVCCTKFPALVSCVTEFPV